MQEFTKGLAENIFLVLISILPKNKIIKSFGKTKHMFHCQV